MKFNRVYAWLRNHKGVTARSVGDIIAKTQGCSIKDDGGAGGSRLGRGGVGRDETQRRRGTWSTLGNGKIEHGILGSAGIGHLSRSARGAGGDGSNGDGGSGAGRAGRANLAGERLDGAERCMDGLYPAVTATVSSHNILLWVRVGRNVI